MPLAMAQSIVTLFETYLAAGLFFAVVFLPIAVERIDPRVAGAPKMLKLLILPGTVAFWPLFAWRWATGAHEPVEKNSHRANAAALRRLTAEPGCRAEPHRT